MGALSPYPRTLKINELGPSIPLALPLLRVEAYPVCMGRTAPRSTSEITTVHTSAHTRVSQQLYVRPTVRMEITRIWLLSECEEWCSPESPIDALPEDQPAACSPCR